MGDLENIKMIDRLINTITFWLAIVIAIVLLVLAIYFSYEHLQYIETNDAQVKANINPVLTPLSGYVKETRFEQDQEVKKGDTLAILENGDKDTAVISSYNGTIALKIIEPGQFLQANQTIANLLDKDQGKWVIANFKETQISTLHRGEKVEIETDAFPGQIYHGRIVSISPATSSSFSSSPISNPGGIFVKIVQRIPVRIAFEDSGKIIGQLATGMSATVKIKK